MKRILALDLATITGWANGSASGAENFKRRAGDSRGMLFIRFEAWLNEMTSMDRKPELIVYERPHARGRAATEVSHGLLGILQKVCAANGVEYADCPSTTLKKFATGKGNAGKPDMIARFVELTGREPVTDDEADAYLLHMWAMEQFN